jgi:hypothetical protein
VGHVDRTKHDWDVMEHVFGGMHAEDAGPHTRIVTMDMRPWLGGITSAVVQVTVNAMSDQQQPPEQSVPDRQPEHDRHRDYDSDRRGEHKYPHQENRPSQRERDELKERLERGR